MKMLKKEAEQRQAIEMLCTDMLVPKGHLLRKIDAAVNFARIYELVEDLYCEDNGRPSCDPVVLFKLVLIQHLFGIRSLRQTMRDAEVNVAYRWFLGYTMSQQLPHFATISYAFRHRFTAEVIEGVFRWILEEVARAGYLSAEVVFVDGTHIKANANLKKQMKKAIPVAAKRYQEQLDEEIEADRAAHGKKPLKKDDGDDGFSAPGKQKMVTESTTDPESGVFHKGEHKKCFAYEAHTVCDRRGYISVWHPFSAADHAGCGSECGLSMVSGVHHVAAAAALCNHQLRIPASIYSRSNRRCVPVDTGGSCPGRIPVCGSRVCGWNAYQSECEPEKANEKGHTGCSETLSGATG